jgi:hypothetical protein
MRAAVWIEGHDRKRLEQLSLHHRAGAVVVAALTAEGQLSGTASSEVKYRHGWGVLLGCGRNLSFTGRLHSPAAGHSHFVRAEFASNEQHGPPRFDGLRLFKSSVTWRI